ncbi:MAG TPA: hypothetical protein VF170_16060 [Planctomycetaceae bacterium]
MDKLKPILTHKFWILAGIALILPLVGWFLGTGALAAAIDQRITTLNGLKPADGATTPNDRWIEKAAVIKQEQAAKVQTTAEFLWSEQKGHMVWPVEMQQYVEGKTFDSDLHIEAQEAYRHLFAREIERLRRIVDPYEYDERAMKYRGAVVLEQGTLPLTDPAVWTAGPPSDREIWYLQEEVWLLESLLRSVRNVNDRAGADSNIIKAPIKQIVSIELRGGDRSALGGAATDEAALDGGDAGHGDGAEGYMPAEAMQMAAAAYGGGEAGAAAGGVDFNMDEEVGPATPAAPAAGEGDLGDAGGDGEHADGGSYMPPEAMAGTPYGAAAGGNPLLTEKRYVEDAPELPYKTRAFKMTVIMDHRQLPEFLVELTNSPFPVDIERVHWAELNPASAYPSNAAGFGGDGYAPPEAGGGFGSMGGHSGGGSFGSGRASMPRAGAMPMPSRGSSMGGHSGGGSFGAARPPVSRPGAMPSFGRGSSMGGHGGGGSSLGGHGGGGSFPRSGAMPVPGSGLGELGGPAGQGNDPYTQAMSDPYLATVVVGGVMTIYKAPEEVQADSAMEGAGDGSAPLTDDAGTAAAPVGEAAPTDGATTDAAAVPAADASGTPSEAPATPQPAAPSAPETTPTEPTAPDASETEAPEAEAPEADAAEADAAAPAAPGDDSAAPPQ